MHLDRELSNVGGPLLCIQMRTMECLGETGINRAMAVLHRQCRHYRAVEILRVMSVETEGLVAIAETVPKLAYTEKEGWEVVENGPNGRLIWGG